MRRLAPCAILALIVVSAGHNVRSDELLYRYEGDVLPYDPAAGWLIVDPCDPPCSESLADGSFILSWPVASDVANYLFWITQAPDEPPDRLWVEWRFRSNHPLGPILTSCDAIFNVDYRGVFEPTKMYGDAAISASGDDVVLGLDLDAFHSYRFESLGGSEFRISVNGQVFDERAQNISNDSSHGINLIGQGGCALDQIPNMVNAWDFVRYGTISFGETIIASDPPAGVLPSSIDRFKVTFDSPNYVYIDDITVTVDGGGPVPAVIKTHRADNDEPDTVEIVLDQPILVNRTTTFTFDDGQATNVVAYTFVRSGACCGSDSTCADATEPDCLDAGGTFIEGESCLGPQACCTGGSCQVLDPLCCAVFQGTVANQSTCEGDLDMDGIDGRCGDPCPNDFFDDTDGDGLCDSVDDCPKLNPNDADNDGTPDCLEEPIIPTVSAWGMIILVLSLVIGARLIFFRGLKPKPDR